MRNKPLKLIAHRMTRLVLISMLGACTAPVYENTVYSLEEFIIDSQQIAGGKQAILALEEHETIYHPEPPPQEDDIIIDGDVLSAVLFCPKRPDRTEALQRINQCTGFLVSEEKISLPHLEPIPAAGLTLVELQQYAQAAYAEQMQDCQIFLSFKKRSERYVQIIGAEVGMIPVDGRTRLSEVIAKARINPHANLFKSYVMRNGESLPIDLYKLIHQGDDSQNITMRGGDQIFIANVSDAAVMVTGEVPFPMAIPVPYGAIPLREAIVRAGGIPYTGNKNCIYVVRGDMVRPKIYQLAWRELIHVPNLSLLLMPGDIVLISERPITEWNRFINQLQPSTGCLYQSIGIYNTVK